MAAPAWSASQVGGIRMTNFRAVYGRSTAPASPDGGSPSAPTTATEPSQALRIARSARRAALEHEPVHHREGRPVGTGLGQRRGQSDRRRPPRPLAGRPPARAGEGHRWPGPRSGRAGGGRCGTRTGRSPRPTRCARRGRAPAPIRVPITAPRNEVVIHSRSEVGAVESRARTRSGVPIRSSSAAKDLAEVGAAALLGALGQDDAPGVPAPGGPGGLEGDQGRRQGVAVVGDAPAVEAVTLERGAPRTAALAPPGERGLLVVVAVDDDRARWPRHRSPGRRPARSG